MTPGVSSEADIHNASEVSCKIFHCAHDVINVYDGTLWSLRVHQWLRTYSVTRRLHIYSNGSSSSSSSDGDGVCIIPSVERQVK